MSQSAEFLLLAHALGEVRKASDCLLMEHPAKAREVLQHPAAQIHVHLKEGSHD